MNSLPCLESTYHEAGDLHVLRVLMVCGHGSDRQCVLSVDVNDWKFGHFGVLQRTIDIRCVLWYHMRLLGCCSNGESVQRHRNET